MSRIIVKNLPVKADEQAIRSHFASRGQITDIKLIRKRNGASRRFAFVGYKTDTDAAEAAEYFNHSFMNSSRIEVGLAKSVHDEELAERKMMRKRKRERELEGEEDADKKPAPARDEKLEEFLSVMQPSKKVATWKNDSTETHISKDTKDDDIVDLRALEEQRANVNGGTAEDSAEELEEPTTAEVADELQDVDEDDEEVWVPQAVEEPATSEPMSDLEWLRRKHTQIRDNGEKITGTEVLDKSEPETKPSVVSSKQPNRLFLRNLAYTATREDLEALFAPYGRLTQVHIPLDKRTDRPKGIAFIEFEDSNDADEARNLDGTSFQGRLLHIIDADAQKSYVLDEFDLKQMPLKKQKAIKRRMQAAREQFSWNSLYMNPDTVVEAAASKLGVSKSEFLDPTNSNMAVQQALAESSMLASVQQYFKSKGLDVAKFKPKHNGGLSDTVILVKNLPFGVHAEEIQDMFAQFGEVVRTLMPPDGGVAVVQFKLASAGRKAFQKLAFRRVGESIIYLQKAPAGALDETASSDAEPAQRAVEARSAGDVLLPAAESVVEASDETSVRTSVFVKNLNFSTPVSSLFKLFQPLSGFVTAVIKTKPDPQNSGKQLSMGFGFAEFRSAREAELAVNALQNYVLDGHSLQLKLSTRGAEPGVVKATTTKIVIKNIPFETTKKDIVDLFGTFGKLRSVRVPRKYNRQTRGFAFAEFVTLAEAEHAMTSLQGAHLLGRRLIMDFAEADAVDPEEEIRRMEQKVASQVDAMQTSSMRLNQQRGIELEDE